MSLEGEQSNLIPIDQNWKVQAKPCKTCPFEGETPIELHPENYRRYVEAIVTFQSQHVCHASDNTKLCRGGRTLMLRVMCARGIIDKATDAAFEAARDADLGF